MGNGNTYTAKQIPLVVMFIAVSGVVVLVIVLGELNNCHGTTQENSIYGTILPL
jgi:hypothetical protein